MVGSRLENTPHGSGRVTFVGVDYVGIAFDDGGDALIRRETLEEVSTPFADPVKPHRDELPWPESTFVQQRVDAHHFMGSRWEPFEEDSKDVMTRLPDIAEKALLQTGYGDDRKSSRVVPEDWPIGFQLVWPVREQGLALVLHPEKEGNMLVSIFPFCGAGSQCTLVLRAVTVWEGGLEAQITASWGESEITFFDTQYVINRAWYEAGKNYDFIISGMAYSAGPAQKHEWSITRHPDEVAWMNQRLKEGEEPHAAACTMSMDGAAMFMPIGEWDVDDYSFHAPVKSVTEFRDWLGQDGWRVRATVMRFDDGDADVDILITRRVWSGDAPPQVGQDIEGRLWLQGHLWMPK